MRICFINEKKHLILFKFDWLYFHIYSLPLIMKINFETIHKIVYNKKNYSNGFNHN